jgi:hypothetical protein
VLFSRPIISHMGDFAQGMGAVRPGTIVWGLGAKFGLGGLSGKTTAFKSSSDDSMALADDKGGALVVDFSGASGAAALIAAVGAKDAPSSGTARGRMVSVGGASVAVVTLNKGEHPNVTTDGAKITVGKQVLTLVDGKFDVAVMGR